MANRVINKCSGQKRMRSHVVAPSRDADSFLSRLNNNDERLRVCDDENDHSGHRSSTCILSHHPHQANLPQDAVVLVGLYDGKKGGLEEVGSGFIVDGRRGLVVTAAHTVLDLTTGAEAKGLRYGRILIGVSTSDNDATVFRYTARVVAKDPALCARRRCCRDDDERSSTPVDVCVLRLETRLDRDVRIDDDGDDVGTVTETVLGWSRSGKQRLPSLRLSERSSPIFRRGDVAVVGFRPQAPEKGGARSVLGATKGVVAEDHPADGAFLGQSPVAVTCLTVGGESGGPCVDRDGTVIGVLSQGDDEHSYLVSARDVSKLVKQAKQNLKSGDDCGRRQLLLSERERNSTRR